MHQHQLWAHLVWFRLGKLAYLHQALPLQDLTIKSPSLHQMLWALLQALQVLVWSLWEEQLEPQVLGQVPSPPP